ncbi:MAG: hypothetical protein K0R21_768 [Anaerocolumna sp.]|nr:hypothetical protein [Anaerocolumna sp.]
MLIQSPNFNIQQIADSGQCFRMNKINENQYSLIAYSKYIVLTQIDSDKVEINCSEEEFEEVWKDYFDLEYNYQQIVDNLTNGQDTFLKAAAEYGNGLRILKQEPFEMLISFIISQNKNIPAIKRTIEKLCIKYGSLIENELCGGIETYAFPTPESLAGARLEDLRETGLGYRDAYILRSAQSVVNREIDLTKLRTLNTDEVMKHLTKLHGVGVKVANCVSLYGLHHIENAPVDVWIARVLKEIYQNKFDWKKYEGIAGIIQQYMFYYMRNHT